MTHPADKDAAYTREDMAQAWMDGAFYYGGDAAEQWYFNDDGAACNPYVTPPAVTGSGDGGER